MRDCEYVASSCEGGSGEGEGGGYKMRDTLERAVHLHPQAFSVLHSSLFLSLKNPITMVYISKLACAVAAACLAGSVVAHPGEHHDPAAIRREVAARNQMAHAAKRSINSCSSSVKAREVAARSVARRAEVARDLRQKRNIQSCK